MSPRGTTFALTRFAVVPVTADVVLLELEGELTGAPARAGSPRLLVEGEAGRREHRALDARLEAGALRASFAVPADAAGAELALAVGGLLIGLPEPDPVPGADRIVALAREVNALRHELTRLEAAAASADARVTTVGREAAARIAAAEEQAARHQAAADSAAAARVAEAEHAAGERQAEALRVAAERQAELEQALAALEAARAEERESAERRDELAAAERAVLQRKRDEAREALAAAEDLAATEDLAAEDDLAPVRSGDAEDTTVVSDPDRSDAEPGAPSTREEDDPPPAERPRASARDALTPPEDTGPIALRRGAPRRPPGAPGPRGLPARGIPDRLPARERPRAPARPAASEADPGLLGGLSPRTLAVVATVLGLLLVVLAVLGVVL